MPPEAAAPGANALMMRRRSCGTSDTDGVPRPAGATRSARTGTALEGEGIRYLRSGLRAGAA
ncbi:hypothetical protein GCM10010272_25950 [Streptomyces lateritius]|nr:hypothetical protein GCM10010272_25950 [Streptomyces lateritius]